MTPRQQLHELNNELAECHAKWADDREQLKFLREDNKDLLDKIAILTAQLDDIRWDVAFVNRQWHEAEHALKLHTSDSIVKMIAYELDRLRKSQARKQKRPK